MAARTLSLRIALLVLLLAAAWRLLSLGAAEHWAMGDPDRALRWRPEHPTALLAAAQALAYDAPADDSQAATARADDRIAALARRALSVDPQAGAAYRLLGEQAELAGNLALAEAMYRISARRSPRDLWTLRWLAWHEVRERRPAPALAYLDQALRVSPGQLHKFFPMLHGLASFAPSQPALLALLRQSPPWREDLLTRLCRAPGDSRALAPVFTGLRGGLSEAEQGSWLNCLIADQRWGEAYVAWFSQLPAAAQRRLPLVFNGDFELPPSGRGFDWRLPAIPGVQAERVRATDGDGHALELYFIGQRLAAVPVQELLLLAPGRYVLRGRARLDQLQTGVGLEWALSCAVGKRELGQSPAFRGSQDWTPFEAELQVPADCPAQWLQLRSRARIGPEQEIAGLAWFDDLTISPLAAGANRDHQ